MTNGNFELCINELKDVAGGIIPDGYCLANGPAGEGLHVGPICKPPQLGIFTRIKAALGIIRPA